jgi:GDP-4-dehydro-6-deoxy-D-mannose reductase
MRPVDVADMRGDPDRLRRTTGWRPSIPLDQTLADVLDYWLTVTPAANGEIRGTLS